MSENEPKIGKQKKEIQSNVTDNESAKMATSHGVIQGYNANAMVNEAHQVIVNADAYGPGDDGKSMHPMLDGAKRNFEAIGKRLVIVEPVFGNIRAQKRMDRFTLRGQLKVRIQWLLYCIVHNVEKVSNYGTYSALAV